MLLNKEILKVNPIQNLM